MADPTIAKLRFMDGCAVEDKVRIFYAGDPQTGNFNVTRLCLWRGGDEWYFWDAKSVVVSVAVVPKPKRTYFALGRDGKIYGLVAGGDFFNEAIPDAGTGKGKLGYLSQVREIDGQVYACGDQGQVYRRTPKGWVHVDDGLMHPERRKQGNSLNGIDGTSEDDLYAVGDYGRIFHYDGKKWTQVGYQTSAILERVRCVGKDEVYVCGDGGLLLKGSRKGWKSIGDPGIKGNIWDLEMYKGKLYLAVEDELMVHDGKSIDKVDPKLEVTIDAHRLSSRNGFLWSFGEKEMAYFDGKKWTRVVDPDNA